MIIQGECRKKVNFREREKEKDGRERETGYSILFKEMSFIYFGLSLPFIQDMSKKKPLILEKEIKRAVIAHCLTKYPLYILVFSYLIYWRSPKRNQTFWRGERERERERESERETVEREREQL